MKITLIGITFVAATAIFQPVVAQDQEDRRGQRDGQREGRRGPPPHLRELEALNLSAEQQSEAELLFQTQREEMRALREADASCEDRQALRAQIDQNLSEILTEEQNLAWQEQKSARPPRRSRDDRCAEVTE